MLSQPAPGSIELLVLASVEAEGSTVATLSQRLGRHEGAVRDTVDRLARNGLVEESGEVVSLTEHGRIASTTVRGFLPTIQAGSTTPTIELADFSRFVGMFAPAVAGQRATRASTRDKTLASHADRDVAVQRLSEAFADGRLSSTELEERTGQALTARTHGDLNAALAGLGGMPTQPRRRPVRRAVFWVAAVMASPWVLFGTLLALFGVDTGDHVGGIFILLLTLPGLFMLGRWAWRRT